MTDIKEKEEKDELTFLSGSKITRCCPWPSCIRRYD